MSVSEIRAWCRDKWGVEWWNHRDKKARKQEAKAALTMRGNQPNPSPDTNASKKRERPPDKADAGNKAPKAGVVNETVTWHRIEAYLRDKYGDKWQEPDPDPDGTPGWGYQYGLRCDRAYDRVNEARDALAKEPLPDDFDARLGEAAVVAREFLGYRENKSFKKTACFSCNQDIHCGHLYLVDFMPNRKRYTSGYTVGCSHTEYDGEAWCDFCCTLIRVKDQPVVQCTRCAQIDWGRPTKDRDYYA